MSKFVITGWEVGFNKVGMNKLLRKYFGYCLSSAKEIVDAILVGEKVVLLLAEDNLEEVKQELQKVNVIFFLEN